MKRSGRAVTLACSRQPFWISRSSWSSEGGTVPQLFAQVINLVIILAPPEYRTQNISIRTVCMPVRKYTRLMWDILACTHTCTHAGYIPRDNLDIKHDVLDWHGDHLHTNYHKLLNHLRCVGEWVWVWASVRGELFLATWIAIACFIWYAHLNAYMQASSTFEYTHKHTGARNILWKFLAALLLALMPPSMLQCWLWTRRRSITQRQVQLKD